jgi:hypothetical protein
MIVWDVLGWIISLYISAGTKTLQAQRAQILRQLGWTERGQRGARDVAEHDSQGTGRVVAASHRSGRSDQYAGAPRRRRPPSSTTRHRRGAARILPMLALNLIDEGVAQSWHLSVVILAAAMYSAKASSAKRNVIDASRHEHDGALLCRRSTSTRHCEQRHAACESHQDGCVRRRDRYRQRGC